MFDRKLWRRLSPIFFLCLFDLLGLKVSAGRQSDYEINSAIKHGIVLREQGEFYQAISVFEDELYKARIRDDARTELDCLMNLGILQWNIGQVKKSDEIYCQALSLSQKLSLKEQETQCAAYIKIYEAYILGKEACASGLHQDSIAHFGFAIELARKMNSPEHELKCLRQMSLNYHQQEAHVDFVKINQIALKLSIKLNHRREEGRCLNNIGIFYYETYDYSRALVYFEKALLIMHETHGNQTDLSACLNNIGLILKELGNYKKAIPFFEEALKIDRNLGDEEGVSIDLNNLGSTYHRKSKNLENEIDLGVALEFYLSSLDMAREGKNKKLLVDILNNIGIVYGNLGRFSLSLKYFRMAIMEAELIGYDYELSNINSNIGYVFYKLGNYIEAESCFYKALQLAIKAGRNDVLWEAYLGLGQCSENMHNSESALASYRKAVNVIEIMRVRIALDDYKAGFVRDKMKAYEALLNLLYDRREKEMTLRYDKEIFEVVEKAKARAFLEELGRSARLSPDPIDQAYRDEEASLSKKISMTISELIRPDLDEARRQKLLNRLGIEEDQYTSLLNRIKTEMVDYSGITSPQVISVDQTQEQHLDGRSAILEYYLGEKRSFGFLITKDNLLLKTLPSKAEIENSLRAYLKMLSTPPEGNFKGIPAARRIYRDLVLPFQEGISQGIDRLILIPDGILHYLPFETLVRDDGRSPESRYLIELYDMSYAPSLSSLVYMMGKQSRGQHRKKLLVVGDPIYISRNGKMFKARDGHGEALREIYLDEGFELSSLPYSKREVRHVAGCFQDDEVDMLMESHANEEEIKGRALDEYQFIHFACHGFLDETTPMRSALVLTLDDDPNEDGFLQAREISNLRLDADLVVLSACQTGKGRLEKGEGVLGLPRSFFYAGARSTISSLWKIKDKSTAEIMPDFYSCLAAGYDKARALRLAKLNMLKSRFSHPFYWAAFVLNGAYL